MPRIKNFRTILLLILLLPKIEIWELLNINPNLNSETLLTYLHTPLDILAIALSCHQYAQHGNALYEALPSNDYIEAAAHSYAFPAVRQGTRKRSFTSFSELDFGYVTTLRVDF